MNSARIQRAVALMEQARRIHELQHHMDLDELRARFDDLTRIVEKLSRVVAEIATLEDAR